MKQVMNILSAFILAIFQMFSFIPKDRPLRQSITALKPFNPTIKESFEATWRYIGNAVKNGQKQ